VHRRAYARGCLWMPGRPCAGSIGPRRMRPCGAMGRDAGGPGSRR
jgi:hypothetical protein